MTTTPETVRRTLGSELIKLRTLRSHLWLLATAAAFLLFLGPVQALGQVLQARGVGIEGDDADLGLGGVALALAGTTTAALLVGVLGVLLVTGEYAPRAIRTTFAAVPRRGYVVLARSLALGLVVLVTSAVAVAAAVSVTLWMLTFADIHIGWGSPDVPRVSAATVWYLVGWGVLGAAVGWLTRSKIGGAAVLLGVMLVLAPVLSLIPGRAGAMLTQLMPSSVGGAMMSTQHADALGAPWAGFVLWTGYLVLFTALSAWVVSRRDA
jgi:ABC-2 type transport system permease protein